MAKRILICDDEPNIVISLEFLMERSGFEVAAARDGDDALRQIEAFAPDLVLLDVMMPRAQRLRGVPAYPRQPRLAAHQGGHAHGQRDGTPKQAKGLALGADAYVTKPFSTRELVAQVRELLGESD